MSYLCRYKFLNFAVIPKKNLNIPVHDENLLEKNDFVKNVCQQQTVNLSMNYGSGVSIHYRSEISAVH